MNSKKITAWLLKLAAAMLTAFLILNIACRYYYYIPWNEASQDGATDFRFPANFRGYNGIEGFAPVILDENGFNNPSVPETIDILCMGSSHSLGYCVDPGQSWPELLAEQLEKKTTYNISIFSHALVNCLGNLEAALETYQPTEYVVIEFPNAVLDYEELCDLNAGQVQELNEVTSPLMTYVKRFSYLQLAGHQVKNLLSKNAEPVETINSTTQKPDVDLDDYTVQLSQALQTARAQAEDYGCQLVLVYHASFDLDAAGAPLIEASEYLDILTELCESNGIHLLNAQEAFRQDYLQNQRLHYGFSNTTPGSGHLNVYGNLVIAEEVADALYGK